MFNEKSDYGQAIESARVNKFNLNRKRVNMRFFVINSFVFALLFLVGYLGFNYLDKENSKIRKKAIMGVTYLNPNYISTDGELMEMVTELHTEVETLKREVDMKRAVDGMVHSGVSNSYQHGASRAIYVQHGDTLASLAEEFYGSEKEYQKIVDANEKLKSGSYVIFVGEKLNIPY